MASDDYQTIVTPLGNQYLKNEPSYAPPDGRYIIYLAYPHLADNWFHQTPISEVRQNVNMESGDYTKVWQGVHTHAWVGAKEITSIASI